MTRLRPCPFCGFSARLRRTYPIVGCWAKKCPVKPQVFRKSLISAIDAWNARATDPKKG